MKVFNNVKVFAKDLSTKVKRSIVGVGLAVTAVVGSAMTAMAADAEANASIGAALESGLNQTVSDFVGYVALVLPIGLIVFGSVFGVKKAKNFFKIVAN